MRVKRLTRNHPTAHNRPRGVCDASVGVSVQSPPVAAWIVLRGKGVVRDVATPLLQREEPEIPAKAVRKSPCQMSPFAAAVNPSMTICFSHWSFLRQLAGGSVR